MIKGFLKFYEQNGALPLWNLYGWETNMMIGYHAVPVIVDAYLKGIGNFDPEKALEACIATANRDDYRGIGDYKKLGLSLIHIFLVKQFVNMFSDYFFSMICFYPKG